MNGDPQNDIALWARRNNQKGRLVVLTRNGSGYSVNTYPTPETDATYSMAIEDINAMDCTM